MQLTPVLVNMLLILQMTQCETATEWSPLSWRNMICTEKAQIFVACADLAESNMDLFLGHMMCYSADEPQLKHVA